MRRRKKPPITKKLLRALGRSLARWGIPQARVAERRGVSPSMVSKLFARQVKSWPLVETAQEMIAEAETRAASATSTAPPTEKTDTAA